MKIFKLTFEISIFDDRRNLINSWQFSNIYNWTRSYNRGKFPPGAHNLCLLYDSPYDKLHFPISEKFILMTLPQTLRFYSLPPMIDPYFLCIILKAGWHLILRDDTLSCGMTPYPAGWHLILWDNNWQTLPITFPRAISVSLSLTSCGLNLLLLNCQLSGPEVVGSSPAVRLPA